MSPRSVNAPYSPMLSAALAHAAAGRPVFPCARNKKPLIPRAKGGHGLHDATRDRDQIIRWWSQSPEALIGMPTGRASRLWVLDVDLHGEVRGDESLADLERGNGRLPNTVQSITPSGGYHFFFSSPPTAARS